MQKTPLSTPMVDAVARAERRLNAAVALPDDLDGSRRYLLRKEGRTIWRGAGTVGMGVVMYREAGLTAEAVERRRSALEDAWAGIGRDGDRWPAPETV